jgi:hypothetical protein
MDCFKSYLDIFLKGSIQTSVVNSDTVTYKPFAPADNPAQLEFSCSGHSDFYTDLNSVRPLLRLKILKTDVLNLRSDGSNTVVCVNILLHSMFRSLSVSVNGTAYLEKLLNHGPNASGTHLVSSFWYLDLSADDGTL